MQNFFNADVVIFNKQSKPMHGYLEFSELGSTVPLNVMNPHEANMGNIIITNQYGKLSGTGAGTGVSQVLLQDKNYTVRYYEFIGTTFDIQDSSQFELIRTLDYFASNYKSEFDNDLGTKVTLENMLDLRNFDPSDSSYVELIGYYTPLDMWSSTYKFEPFSVRQDDGGGVIKSNLSEWQNGRWHLVDNKDQIDIRQFGVRANEDTGVQALNAFNYCNENDKELVFTAVDGYNTVYRFSGTSEYICKRALLHNRVEIVGTGNFNIKFKIDRFRRSRQLNKQNAFPAFKRGVGSTGDFILIVDEISTDDVEDSKWLSWSDPSDEQYYKKVIVNNKRPFHTFDDLYLKNCEVVLNEEFNNWYWMSFFKCRINDSSIIKCFTNNLNKVSFDEMTFEAKFFTDDFNFKEKMVISSSEKCIVTLDNCRQADNEQRAGDIYLDVKYNLKNSDFESFENLSINSNRIRMGYSNNRVVLKDIKNASNNVAELIFQSFDDEADFYIDIINCEGLKINLNSLIKSHVKIYNSSVEIMGMSSLKAVDSTLIVNHSVYVNNPKFFELINVKQIGDGFLSAEAGFNTYTAVVKNSEFDSYLEIKSDHLICEDNVFRKHINFRPKLIETWDGHVYYQLLFNRNRLQDHLVIRAKYDEGMGIEVQNKVKVWLEAVGNIALTSNNIIIFKDKRVNLYDDKQHVYRYENNICNTKQNGYESTVPFYFWQNNPQETMPAGKNGLGVYALTNNNNPQVLTQFGSIDLYLIKFSCGIHFDVDVKLEFIAKEVGGVLEHPLSSSVMKLKMWSYPKTWQEYRMSNKLYTYNNDQRLLPLWDYSEVFPTYTSSVDLYKVKMNRVVGFNETDSEEFQGNVKWGSFMIDLFAFNIMSTSEEPFNVHCKLTVL